MSIDRNRLGRFDQSFVVRMITDFFLILVLVVVVELAVRFGLVMYDFHTTQKVNTQEAAKGLATDIRQIMMNRGGPVAARTVYPIIEENYDRMGLQIAVVPTEVTRQSISEQFGFEPEGIPARWPEGTHHAATLPIKADRFCLQCHREAAVGDVLGRVTVRNYLRTHLSAWWAEVRLTGLMSMMKILLHTTVLFFLLRIRMAPLLTLRAVVSDLAKGGSDLSRRAPVNSADEFGELAADLNHFLDRIAEIVADLTAVLDRVSELNQRLESLQNRMDEGAEEMEERIDSARQALGHAESADPIFSAEWREAMQALRAVLQRIAVEDPRGAELAACFDAILDRLEAAGERSRRLGEAQVRSQESVEALATEFRAFHRAVGEMETLDEKMATIASTGRALIARLEHAGEAGDGER